MRIHICSKLGLALLLMLLTPLALSAGKSEAGTTVATRISVQADAIAASNANANDQAAILAAVKQYWHAYLHGDSAALAKLFAPDLRRLSQRAGTVQDDAKLVLTQLPKEWQAFERPNGAIAEAMTLAAIEIEVDSKSSPAKTAIVRSAQQCFDYLKANRASFPVIEAINTHSGLDAQSGYVQVYATDSEGNGLIFTEYTGRRR